MERYLLNVSSPSPIDSKNLKYLHQYKYSGVDLSIMSKLFLNRYWNWLIELFPMWMAPNLITLLGLLSVLSAFSMVAYFWILTANTPTWLYYYSAIAIFMYQSLDAIDGKQARRTGTGSPLGQLFDHGCDALNIFLQAFMIPVMTKVQNALLSYCLVAGMLLAFYAATWEEYHTGTLLLGYISGPVEGQIANIVMILLGGILDPALFHQITIPLGSKLALPLNECAVYIVLLGAIITILSNMRNVYRHSGVNHLWQLLPLTIFLALVGCIIGLGADGKSSWNLCSVEGRAEYFLLSMAVGLAFSNSTFRVICAHLCHQSYPWWVHGCGSLLLALLFTTLSDLKLMGKVQDYLKITRWLCLLYAAHRNLYDYGGMVYTVVHQFCDFLKVKCFTIPSKPSSKSAPKVAPKSPSKSAIKSPSKSKNN